MAKEFGPYYAPGYVAVYNPAMPGQVRQVSGTGSPAWVTESATFTECRIALVQVGATGVYYADIPAGLTFDRDYSVGVYDAAATTFSQALSVETYGPDVSPTNITQVDGSAAAAQGLSGLGVAYGSVGYIQVNLARIAGQLVTASGLVTFPAGTISSYAGGDTAGTSALLARVTAARAGHLDNLNTGGLIATASQVAALYNMSRVSLDVPPQLLVPVAGTKAFAVTARLYDADSGNMAAPDATPTLAATLGDGTDVSARLSAASLVSIGVYRWTYTSDSAHAVNDQVRFDVTFVEDGSATSQGASAFTVAAMAADFTAQDRTDLLATKTDAAGLRADLTTARAANLDNLDAPILSRMPTFVYTAPPSAATISSQVAADLAAAHGNGAWGADLTGLPTTTVFNTAIGQLQAAIGYSGVGDDTIKEQDLRRPKLDEVATASAVATAAAILLDPAQKLFTSTGGEVRSEGQPTQPDLAYIHTSLAAILGKVNQFGSSTLTHVTSPVKATGEIEIVQGDDYLAANPLTLPSIRNYIGPQLDTVVQFAVMTASDYDKAGASATALLQVEATALATTETDGTTTLTVTVPLTAAQTAALPSSPLQSRYNLVYHVLGTVVGTEDNYSPYIGPMTVKRRIAV
ncbi:MAG TPA: hypothetical protein VGN72_10135 [Tepidisphaeraceae bacterium]|jgi:hypothetical protein|nr:hypothetical protein [Tepidisphaeraceae bacterium]